MLSQPQPCLLLKPISISGAKLVVWGRLGVLAWRKHEPASRRQPSDLANLKVSLYHKAATNIRIGLAPPHRRAITTTPRIHDSILSFTIQHEATTTVYGKLYIVQQAHRHTILKSSLHNDLTTAHARKELQRSLHQPADVKEIPQIWSPA